MKFICIIILGLTSFLKAQIVSKIELVIPKTSYASTIPLSIEIDKYTKIPADQLKLVKVDGDRELFVPSQVNESFPRRIFWLEEKSEKKSEKHFYKLVKDTIQLNLNNIRTKLADGKLTFQKDDKKYLSYQYKTVYPPEGTDSNYKRSAFIHPVYSPHGQILTQIQPDDHYHHYGIWNPWTHVLFESDTVDFWNLAKHEGTVRFGDFVSIIEGPIYSEFKALHKHIVFKSNNEKTALNELQTIRIYNTDDVDTYIVDMTIELNCASDSPVNLLEYRYGGLGWRATEKWDKYNSEVLTSEGKTRIDADGSLARWFLVQGEIDNDYAGILMMSYPTNYNHPEPVRIWPIPEDKRGDVFANFSPTKNKDWELLPGKLYVLKYRFIVFNGKMSKEKAETQWQNYTNNISIKIEK